jgi:hypothetical protein
VTRGAHGGAQRRDIAVGVIDSGLSDAVGQRSRIEPAGIVRAEASLSSAVLGGAAPGSHSSTRNPVRAASRMGCLRAIAATPTTCSESTWTARAPSSRPASFRSVASGRSGLSRMKPVRALYIMGTSRSGTTLLGEVLGQVPGLAYGGEFRWLWDQAGSTGPCGCGSAVQECSVWSKVLAETAVPHPGEDYVARTSQLMGEAVGRKHSWVRALGLLLSTRLKRPNTSAAAQYGQRLVATYSSFLSEVGEGWVVDSSSEPSDAALLSGLAGVDLRVVHLVRDPRGVVYSHKRAESSAVWSSPDLRAAYLAGAWLTSNLMARLVLRRLGPSRSVQIRYEDLVAGPTGTLKRVLALVGAEVPDGLITEGKIKLGVTHSAAGNPRRFRMGQVELVEDLSWQSGLPPSQQRLVRVLCAPLASAYGYR